MKQYAQVLVPLPLKTEFTYEIPEHLMVLAGMRVVVPFGKRELTAAVIDVLNENPHTDFEIKPIKRVIDKEPIFFQDLIDLAHWMASFYHCGAGEALAMMLPGGRRDSGMPPLDADDGAPEIPDDALTEEQKRAITTILDGRKKLYYLYGITGSGKSEVFFRVAEEVMKQGKDVIYLVPEITLTHQLAHQVKARFKGNVAVLHSGLTPSQKLAEWRKILHGEVKLVIGARSAVFAPCKNLGLIIIDEEHENSYKSGSTPRYHARQVAQKRVHDHGATLLMGSATPSLEAWLLMEDGNSIEKIELTQRVAGGTPPHIELVTMLGEPSLISRQLYTEMKAVLDRGKQVILFLNRRGFSYFFHCRSCGYEMTCPHCAVSLTYHKERADMICHYCGYTRKPVTVCPECGSLDVGYSGFGTEMVEEEVAKKFPGAALARLDTDTTQDRNAVPDVLNAFRDGKINILLGTQMVAKGLNFPGVELVGIVLADNGMNIPDFRAQERTYSLLVQVSGRAGRYSDKGRVIVQTYRPDNPAIKMAVEGKHQEFYHEELLIRKETGFPPFARMATLVLRGRNREKVSQTALGLSAFLQDIAAQMQSKQDYQSRGIPVVLHAAECPIAKIAGNWRYQILISGVSIQLITILLDKALEQWKTPSGIYLEIDIDPLQFM